MTLDEFRQSLTATEPPAGLAHALARLWWDAKGDWKRAQPAERPKLQRAEQHTQALQDELVPWIREPSSSVQVERWLKA